MTIPNCKKAYSLIIAENIPYLTQPNSITWACTGMVYAYSNNYKGERHNLLCSVSPGITSTLGHIHKLWLEISGLSKWSPT